eukprot:660968-Pelagomonas_calceolata.AAC.1
MNGLGVMQAQQQTRLIVPKKHIAVLDNFTTLNVITSRFANIHAKEKRKRKEKSTPAKRPRALRK